MKMIDSRVMYLLLGVPNLEFLEYQNHISAFWHNRYPVLQVFYMAKFTFSTFISLGLNVESGRETEISWCYWFYLHFVDALKCLNRFFIKHCWVLYVRETFSNRFGTLNPSGKLFYLTTRKLARTRLQTLIFWITLIQRNAFCKSQAFEILGVNSLCMQRWIFS